MLPRINRARTHVHASETRNTVCCSVELSFYSTFVGFFSQFFTLELQNSELNEEHGDTDRHVHSLRVFTRLENGGENDALSGL